MKYNIQREGKRICRGFLWLPKTLGLSFTTLDRETHWLEHAKWFEVNDGYGWLDMYWHSDALERYFRAFGDFEAFDV